MFLKLSLHLRNGFTTCKYVSFLDFMFLQPCWSDLNLANILICCFRGQKIIEYVSENLEFMDGVFLHEETYKKEKWYVDFTTTFFVPHLN